MDAEARAALRRAGLDVKTIQRDKSDTFRFFKAGEADLETNRTALVDGLLACVGEAGGDLRFDTKITGLRATAAGAVELLAEGDEVLGEFDVVVDATGTHSPLRRYRFASTPRYTVRRCGRRAGRGGGLTIKEGCDLDPRRRGQP